MKLSKNQLRRIIREEHRRLMEAGPSHMDYSVSDEKAVIDSLSDEEYAALEEICWELSDFFDKPIDNDYAAYVIVQMIRYTLPRLKNPVLQKFINR